MARPRPPRDREAAPGEQPGAESFPQSVPQGIVRLSDLFAPEDFDVPAASASKPARPRRNGGIRATDADNSAQDRRAGRARSRPATGVPTAPDAVSAIPADSNRGDAPSDVDTSHHVPIDPDSAPAYEGLFGDDGDTRRRPRRERKPATALQRALGLLTRREHSRKELTRKLVSRGVDAAEVEAAVDKLAGAGWQDDRRFAESLVRSRAANGYGPLHIRAELGTHDLPAEVRQAALDEFEGDWTGIARDLVERRFARIEDPRQRERKAADYLMRRGFPSDVARTAARFPTGD
jgi:regulatory protein